MRYDAVIIYRWPVSVHPDFMSNGDTDNRNEHVQYIYYITIHWLLFCCSIDKTNKNIANDRPTRMCKSKSRIEPFDYRPARLRDHHFRAETVELVPQVRTFQFQARFRPRARPGENYFRCRVSVAMLRHRRCAVSGWIAHVTRVGATSVAVRLVVS